MRVIAVVRQVLDAEESVTVVDGQVSLDGRKLVMDTMDEYGVEEALRLRESSAATEVLLLAVGPARVEAALRAGLAMGADRAILVESEIPVDVIAVSDVVAQIARSEQAELIFCGGQQSDWDSHALGPATAERLGWVQATWTNKLALQNGLLTGRHDVDAGNEEFSAALPAVVTTQQGLNEPRYPTLPNIMKAKTKELRRVALESLNVRARLTVLGSEVQVKQRRRTMLDGKDAPAAAAKLVALLRNEAKVIA